MEKIYEKIDALMDDYTKILEDVVCIESPSAIKSRVDEVGKYFINLAHENGWETEIEKFEEYGDVVTVIMNRNAPGDVITLSGHMDTVHPVGLFGYPPAKRAGDKLFGPGAMDCKGGRCCRIPCYESSCGYGLQR